jgi:hypothetical protein
MLTPEEADVSAQMIERVHAEREINQFLDDLSGKVEK